MSNPSALIERVYFIEKPLDLEFPKPVPLYVHARYTRDQILAGLHLHRFEQASSNREGVANNPDLNLEALFVTLKKSEKEYSPSTMYDDYALSEDIFHWQSQNSTSPESPRGLSYIHHQETGKVMLLFVREQNRDEYGNTMSYVFLGDANYLRTYGARPMNLEWQLKEPIPAYLLSESKKLAVG